MSKIYKTGPWSKTGRVMPGKRSVPKIIDQIHSDGTVTQEDHDQTFSPIEIKSLLNGLFPDSEEKDGHVYLPPIKADGKGIYFYTRNISHLGGNWGSEKKRIQIGSDFPDLYERNKSQNIETVLVGIYHYYPDGKAGVILFVCFSPITYASRKTNNSAAHIHTIDLLNGFNNGVYRRIDRSGNELLVLDTEHFIQHINYLRGIEKKDLVKKDHEILAYLGQMYNNIPKKLNGIACYEEMRKAGDKTRMNQAAWEGWYYEFYVEKYLKDHPTKDIEWWSKKGNGELDFDLHFTYRDWFYGDVKSDAEKQAVQGNLKDNIDYLIAKPGGRLWYIAIEFVPEMDSNHNFKTTEYWNRKLGKLNKLRSYGKKMKYSITIKRMDIYEITSASIPYLKVCNPSPCAGKERREKYEIPNKMKEFLRIYECV